MTLSTSIRQAEASIAQRRRRLRGALDDVGQSVSTRMVSPPVLITAGLFGAALQKDNRLNGLRMLALFETANAGMRLLLTLTSRAHTLATTR